MDAHRLRRQKKILPPRHEPGSTPMRTGKSLTAFALLDPGRSLSRSPVQAQSARHLSMVSMQRGYVF